jgi:hypothetical protein
MRRDSLFAALVAGAALVACAARPEARTPAVATCRVPPPSACTSPPPDYARDVAPVLERRCFSCHASDGMAADEHDFSKPSKVWAERVALADRVRSCSMPLPPSPPLDPSEAGVLIAWASCSSPP